eukprot:364419-Chlamydomonas_euryale.AAC.4
MAVYNRLNLGYACMHGVDTVPPSACHCTNLTRACATKHQPRLSAPSSSPRHAHRTVAALSYGDAELAIACGRGLPSRQLPPAQGQSLRLKSRLRPWTVREAAPSQASTCGCQRVATGQHAGTRCPVKRAACSIRRPKIRDGGRGNGQLELDTARMPLGM